MYVVVFGSRLYIRRPTHNTHRGDSRGFMEARFWRVIIIIKTYGRNNRGGGGGDDGDGVYVYSSLCSFPVGRGADFFFGVDDDDDETGSHLLNSSQSGEKSERRRNCSNSI